jgi:hypothetical protein
MKYRIHWWYEDRGSWDIEPADSDEARNFMENDPEIDLDPALVAGYERAGRQYSELCEKIREELNRQLVLDKDRKWVPRKNS